MGYSTDFYGCWTLTPALSLAQTDYLQKFARTRRVKRDPDATKNDRRLAAIGLNLGVDAEYFVDVEGDVPIDSGTIEVINNCIGIALDSIVLLASISFSRNFLSETSIITSYFIWTHQLIVVLEFLR